MNQSAINPSCMPERILCKKLLLSKRHNLGIENIEVAAVELRKEVLVINGW